MTGKTVDLDLRRKVAELDGWDSIESLYGEELSGFEAKHSPEDRQSAERQGYKYKVPRYEIYIEVIIGACDRHGIKFGIETIEYANQVSDDYKAVYLCRKGAGGGIESEGKTRAIALCNLFVAVMESRLAENNFSFSVGGVETEYVHMNDQKSPFRDELIRIETPFTRHLLQHIREKALFARDYECGAVNPNRIWVQAYEDIAIAVDRLDAMLARAKSDYPDEDRD